MLPEPTAVAVVLAVDPPTIAGDSSQLVPWSCQPVSKYIQIILVSKIEDFTTSAHVYQRAATKVRTATG